MPREYRVGDLVCTGADPRPSRLIIAADGTAIGYIPIYWVSNGMPNVEGSGIGRVVGNLQDMMGKPNPGLHRDAA